MVKLLLSIKAELENVTDLIPEDIKAFNFFFKVQISKTAILPCDRRIRALTHKLT